MLLKQKKTIYKTESIKTMKRYTLIPLLILLSTAGSFAQSKEAMKKIQSARIALITERLELTPTEAEKFWPVYREFNQERMALRKQLRDTRKNVDMSNLSDEESKRLMTKSLDIKQKELNLEKEYTKRFQKVISTQQILQLRNAEKDFQQMLLRRLQRERQKQLQRQQMMQRRDLMKGQGNN